MADFTVQYCGISSPISIKFEINIPFMTCIEHAVKDVNMRPKGEARLPPVKLWAKETAL